jgi:hypothetical protein
LAENRSLAREWEGRTILRGETGKYDVLNVLYKKHILIVATTSIQGVLKVLVRV